jgi:predicted AlkP superfamily pyrophosphatase or phosphodiesterase
MIARELENVIREQKKEGEFIYPFYEKYCFSNISSTILKFFGIKSEKPILPSEIYKDKVETENSNKIVLLLVDGFGYNQWLKYYKNYEFFDIFSQKGLVSPLTSVFPSTTAATLTTISTGLTPQEHALLEWVLYFKEIDMIINTLPFTPLGKNGQDRLLEAGVSPKILFKGNTIYQTLKKSGIKSFSFINESYAYSAYSKLAYKGSITIPFVNSSDLVVRLRKTLEAEKGPAYFYVYFGDFDSIEHKYGPHTDEYYAELSVLSFLLKKELLEKIDRKVANETLLLITADHGQINVSPKETIYLNKYRELINSFEKSKKKKPILPTGSQRDVFLHIEQSKLNEMYNFLLNKLKEKAKVVKIEEAIKMGLFGKGKPRKEFYDRAGNLLILPYKNHTIWYKHVKNEKFNLLGHHGGLSEDEMLIPFAVAKLSNLL